jgi:hypothetical protein
LFLGFAWPLSYVRISRSKYTRYWRLLLAESHLTWRLFGSMVRRIAALAVPTG